MAIRRSLCSLENAKIRKVLEKGPKFGCRHGQSLLFFLLLTYTYCMRSVLSVAIVAMNDKTTSKNPNIPTYNWDDRSVVLSAFFWGYVIFQIPAAHLGKKYGTKWLLVGSTSLDSLFCILIPTMADVFGSKGVMICRFVQGVAQGFVFPLIHTLLGCWAPPCERSRIGTFTYAGSVFGILIAMPITGLICSSWLGWQYSFYLWGILGFKWVFFWIIFGADKPRCHKKISPAERCYIEGSLGQENHNKKHYTPWKDILKSPPVWALILSNVGVNWGSAILLTQTPTYMNNILQYDIKSNSLLSAAPYLAMWICSLTFSSICDVIINKNITSRGTARKIFNTIGTVVPAVGLLLVGFISKEYAGAAVALFILVGGSMGGGFCGFQVNHMDLSPNHCGILMGLTNGTTSIFSVISPLIVQYIVTEQDNQGMWRTIFFITAAVYIASDVFFVIFGSGEVQPWNEKDEIPTRPNCSNEQERDVERRPDTY